MSTKTRTRNSPAVRKLQPDQQPAATPCTGRTEAEAKLLDVLHTSPNSTVGELASAASIGKSTAGKILAKWANDGSVTRTPGLFEGGRRAADRWVIADDQHDEMETSHAGSTRADTDANRTSTTVTGTTDEKPLETPTSNTEITKVGTAESVTTDPSGNNAADQHQSGNSTAAHNNTHEKASRLAPGALRGMVEDYLREHPSEEFGPASIGKALDRSSGAVANALSLLTERGVVVQTSQAPRRYRIAASD
jgi:DNA-binding MarR family transcriptional regulator